jgi:hypothetical protein
MAKQIVDSHEPINVNHAHRVWPASVRPAIDRVWCPALPADPVEQARQVVMLGRPEQPSAFASGGDAAGEPASLGCDRHRRQ